MFVWESILVEDCVVTVGGSIRFELVSRMALPLVLCRGESDGGRLSFTWFEWVVKTLVRACVTGWGLKAA